MFDQLFCELGNDVNWWLLFGIVNSIKTRREDLTSNSRFRIEQAEGPFNRFLSCEFGGNTLKKI